MDGADHPQRLALLVEVNLGLAVDDALLTVWTNYAVLEVIRFALEKGAVYFLPDQLPVVGMHRLHQLVDGGHKLLRLVTVDPEDLVGPVHLAGLYIPLPVAQVSYPLRLRQAGLAFAQLLLRLLALGDVAGIDHDPLHIWIV